MIIYKCSVRAVHPKYAIDLVIACAPFIVIIAADSPPHIRHIRHIRQRLGPNRRASNRGSSGIDVSLTDDHFNVGQKRLLFLARALVRAAGTENQPRGFCQQREHHHCASDIRGLGYGPREVVELAAPSDWLARDPPIYLVPFSTTTDRVVASASGQNSYLSRVRQ
ncbi:uncharacterized protein P174DRAFT_455715 [Aspergillus novofumigatus IBT 16806]|uniref:Uncharacterized protein n=1 Tax=Aspergillus novofumigatus (strain IBT 16806) TaxID=1392255 RepID=A0A2I1CJX5_ASPN1|nr:uncharacterized protein P174DRAFT_455715 [Aspergillus novofumigatus IBT 16806]PKX97915.1 hypothetical protein P174DRAFT_455715 [Aspergillus novofumigatus IBT 16806]